MRALTLHALPSLLGAQGWCDVRDGIAAADSGRSQQIHISAQRPSRPFAAAAMRPLCHPLAHGPIPTPAAPRLSPSVSAPTIAR